MEAKRRALEAIVEKKVHAKPAEEESGVQANVSKTVSRRDQPSAPAVLPRRIHFSVQSAKIEEQGQALLPPRRASAGNSTGTVPRYCRAYHGPSERNTICWGKLSQMDTPNAGLSDRSVGDSDLDGTRTSSKRAFQPGQGVGAGRQQCDTLAAARYTAKVIIRIQQLDALSRAMISAFEERMVTMVKLRYPQKTRERTDLELRAIIHDGVTRAGDYGIDLINRGCRTIYSPDVSSARFQFRRGSGDCVDERCPQGHKLDVRSEAGPSRGTSIDSSFDSRRDGLRKLPGYGQCNEL